MHSETITTDIKMKNNVLKTALFITVMLSLVSCIKTEEMTVQVDNLWFPEEACVQELKITANCRWSISIDDDADWYSIDPMSGRKEEVVKVTVKALGEVEQRSSSFTITTAKGQIQLQVRVSQNTDEPAELESITNRIFGVSTFAHWNVDYFGEVISESYKRYEYDPYDTASGYQMYFLEDSVGVQKDNHSDSTVYYLFKYFYDPHARIIHFDFEVEGDTTEIYDAPVLVATEELFRFQHEYKPMRWEIADMKKIGKIVPHEKTRIMKATKKRKPTGGVFQF